MIIKRLPNRKKYKTKQLDIGNKIKTAREECGLSQGELADLVGYDSATAISLMEGNKRKTSAVNLLKISRITNLPVTFFYE